MNFFDQSRLFQDGIVGCQKVVTLQNNRTGHVQSINFANTNLIQRIGDRDDLGVLLNIIRSIFFLINDLFTALSKWILAVFIVQDV
jgi:hypothetical protein